MGRGLLPQNALEFFDNTDHYTPHQTYPIRHFEGGAKEFAFSTSTQSDSDVSWNGSAVRVWEGLHDASDLPGTSSCSPHRVSPKSTRVNFGRTSCVWKTEGKVAQSLV